MVLVVRKFFAFFEIEQPVLTQSKDIFPLLLLVWLLVLLLVLSVVFAREIKLHPLGLVGEELRVLNEVKQLAKLLLDFFFALLKVLDRHQPREFLQLATVVFL